MVRYLEQLLISTIYSIIGKIGSVLFRFLSAFYLIRNFSLTDYGTYTLLISLITLTSITTSVGLPGILERYSPEFYAKNDLYGLRKLFLASVIIRLVLSILFILIIFNNTNILSLLKLESLKDFKIVIALIIIFALQIQLIGDVFLTALLKQKFYNLSYLFFSLLEFIGIYTSIKLHWGLFGLFATLAISNIILSLLFLIKSFSILFNNVQTNKLSFPFKRVFKYGFYTSFVVLGYSFVDVWIDNFVINYYLGKESVAYYGFANMIANILTTFAPASLILPIVTSISIVKFSKTNSLKELSAMYTRYNKVTASF